MNERINLPSKSVEENEASTKNERLFLLMFVIIKSDIKMDEIDSLLV